MASGATKITNEAGLQGLNESQLYRSGKDIYKLPSVMSSDKITGGTLVKTIEAVTGTPNYDVQALMDSTNAGTQKLVDTINAPLPEQKVVSDLQTRQNDLAQSISTNKTADIVDGQETYGLKDNVKNLQDISVQMAQAKANYDSLANQTKNLPIANRIIGGTQDRLTRQAAIETAGLAAVAQAYQGNITLATDTLTKAVDAQYKPQEDYLSNLQKQIENSYTDLTAAEKKRADSLNVVLEEKKRVLEEEKQIKSDINSVMLDAAKNGATPDVIKAIQNSKTYSEAIMNAGASLSTPEKIDLPSSFKEWQLAGQPGTFADWVQSKNGTPLNIQKINGVDYQVNPDGSLSTPPVPQITPQEKIDKANKVIDAVKSVQSLDWGSVVGSIQGKLPDWALSGKQAAVNSKINTLKSLLTLENMGIMKGVLSDSDMKIITNASTSLNRATDEKSFDSELKKIKNASTSMINSSNLTPGQIIYNEDGTYSYKNNDGTTRTAEIGDNYQDTTKPPLPNFSQVGGDTKLATVTSVPDGVKGGQCGRFVNKLTGLGLGDSYQSKMAKMDSSIKYPEPGMVFTMPYKDTGHTGFIVGISGKNAIVKDSNWNVSSAPEKVTTHLIPIAKMTGFRKV
jgi:uncharacterized protein (UPF0335 family)